MWLKKGMPQGLLGRSTLIIILPVILVQMIIVFVFYDRHWSKTTELLSENIAGAIGALHTHVSYLTMNQMHEFNTLKEYGFKHFKLKMSYKQDFHVSQARQSLSWQEQHLHKQLDVFLKEPFFLSIMSDSISVHVAHHKGTIIYTTPTKRLFTRTTPLLMWWTIISSLVFLIIAFIFMRNQVRPLKLLAKKVKEFGEGKSILTLKPSGALEVQQVTRAFNDMQSRILKQMTERTQMLAGVSHDLRTFLTRISLEIELMEADTHFLKEDIRLMRSTLDDYLAFARGAENETAVITDIKTIVDRAVNMVKGFSVVVHAPDNIWLKIKPQAMIRCLSNLIQNAHKYARACHVTLKKCDTYCTLMVDDDGPGVPVDQRDMVFQPFFRQDEARNLDQGGVGLGLAIAKDIAQSHGGKIFIQDSSLGGTCVVIQLPLL